MNMKHVLNILVPFALVLSNLLLSNSVRPALEPLVQALATCLALLAFAYGAGLFRSVFLKPESLFQQSENVSAQHPWVSWVLMASWTLAWTLAWVTLPLLGLHRVMFPLLFFGLVWQRLGVAQGAMPALRKSMGLTLSVSAGLFAMLVLDKTFVIARIVSDWTGPLDEAHRHYHHVQVLKAWSAVQFWGTGDLTGTHARLSQSGVELLWFAVSFGALPAMLLGAAFVLGCIGLWNWLRLTQTGPRFSAEWRRLGLALMLLQGAATLLYVLFNLGITRRMGGAGLPPLVPQLAWWILDTALLWIMVKAWVSKRSAAVHNTDVKVPGRRWWISLSGYALSTCVLATSMLIYKEYQRDNTNFAKVASRSVLETRKPILDANGNVIAHNVLAYGLWFKPREFWSPSLLNPRDSSQQENGYEPRRTDAERERLFLDALAPWPQTQRAIQAKLAEWDKNKADLANLAWRVTPEMANKIKDLAMPGLLLKPRTTRHYQEGSLFAHAVGFSMLSDDNRGQDGLELTENSKLATVSAKPDASDQPALRTTLVPDIQRAARDILRDGVKEYRALGGAIVVMDVRRQKIVAMVSAPDFDPNDSASYRHPYQPERMLNRSVSASFPVGSLLTPLVVAHQLESGQINAHTMIHLGKGPMRVGQLRLQDAHVWEDLSVGDVIAKSSNVGFAKLALQMPMSQLEGMSRTLRLGESLGIPGVTGGFTAQRVPWREWTPAMQATAGQRIETNLTQILKAYLPIATNGYLGTPTLLWTDETRLSDKRVLSDQTAAIVRSMLTGVVSAGGTAQLAQVLGTSVAGKTTTQMSNFLIDDDTGKKMKRADTAVFVGMLPAEKPYWLVGVLLEFEHGKGKFAGATSAPMFSQLASTALVSRDRP